MAEIMSHLSGPQGLTGRVGEEAPVRVQVGAKPSLAVRVGGGQALNARPGRGVGVTARLGKRGILPGVWLTGEFSLSWPVLTWGQAGPPAVIGAFSIAWSSMVTAEVGETIIGEYEVAEE